MADVASAFFAKLNELVVMHRRAGVVLWGFLGYAPQIQLIEAVVIRPCLHEALQATGQNF